ncbi:MAG: ABC transporter permease [Propionibacteriaceae bacterium]|jgi:ABC-2 type transport system permease protein|nr:ABC transporter permease [Propionibacteriaceae bacterium]
MVNRVLAIVGKEFLHLIRDPRMLSGVLLLPIIELLLFAYAISFDIRDVPMLVVDQDNTAASREYVASLASGGLFDIASRSDDIAEIDDAFDSSQVKLALVIPSGFGDDLARGEHAQVGVFVDASEPNSGRVARTAATALTQQYNRGLSLKWADVRGLDVSGLGGVEPRLRTWYNPELKSSDFLIPGLMSVILMVVIVQQTAVSLVKERDEGTQDQITVSAVHPIELLVGKLLPWVVLALVEITMITGISWVLFGIPLRGNLLAFGAGAMLYCVCGLALGLVISAVCDTLESANLLAMLAAFLPSFLLSDFAFPLDQIPPFLQWVSYLMPARYMVTMTREVFLKSGDFADVQPEMLSMTVFAVVVLGIAAQLYRRKIR